MYTAVQMKSEWTQSKWEQHDNHMLVFQVQNMSKQNQQAVMQVLGARVVNWPKFM
jgi:hypothetical protein